MEAIFDLETYLEDLECPECHTTGMLGNGGEFYICPVCDHEGSIYEDEWMEEEFKVEEYLSERHCTMCGELGRFKLLEDSRDAYVCLECGCEGSIQDDIQNDKDARDYFWDEALYGYSEADKGEVFDKEF